MFQDNVVFLHHRVAFLFPIFHPRSGYISVIVSHVVTARLQNRRRDRLTSRFQAKIRAGTRVGIERGDWIMGHQDVVAILLEFAMVEEGGWPSLLGEFDRIILVVERYSIFRRCVRAEIRRCARKAKFLLD